MGSENAVFRITHLQHVENEYAKENATHTRHQREYDTLRDNLREDHLGRGTNGPANTYLSGTFAHSDHHNVRHANGTCKQRSKAHEPDEEIDTLEEVVEHLEEYLGIEDHCSLFVRRIHKVSHRHSFTDTVCQLRHDDTLATCSHHHVHLVASIIRLLHQGQWQGHLLFGSSIDVHIR